MKRRWKLAGAAGLILGITVLYAATNPMSGSRVLPETAAELATSQASVEPIAPSLRVAVDPESGQVVAGAAPGADDLSYPLGKMLSRSTEGLEIVTLPDGSEMVNLQGRFRSLSVVHRTEDGSIRQFCVDSEDQARRILGPGESSSAKGGER